MDLGVARSGAGADLARWFTALKDEVQGWEQKAKGVEVPSFEQAVADMIAMKAA